MKEMLHDARDMPQSEVEGLAGTIRILYRARFGGRSLEAAERIDVSQHLAHLEDLIPRKPFSG